VFRYISKRIFATVPVMVMVVVLVFLMLRLSAADPAAIIAGDNATTEQIQDIRVKLGLDQPVLVQFGAWLAKVSTGNLGESCFF
jgi:peptide/nickel transport system permease protein